MFISLQIFNSNESNFKHISKERDSSLIMAINNGMINLAKEIIKKASPELIQHVNNENDNALLLCIQKQYWELAHILIDTKHSNHNHINNYGDNALLLALTMEHKEISSKLIKLDNVNLYYRGYSGSCAYDILLKNGWMDLIS